VVKDCLQVWENNIQQHFWVMWWRYVVCFSNRSIWRKEHEDGWFSVNIRSEQISSLWQVY
jgi:hypothetical protein